MQRKHTRRRKIPRSGDCLIDTLFLILLDTLEKEITAIRMKKDLRDPDNRKIALRGLLTKGKIYLGKRAHTKRQPPIVSTFIHELWHETMKKTFERRISRLEEILWMRFTEAQKRHLRQYIPKYTVKENPARIK